MPKDTAPTRIKLNMVCYLGFATYASILHELKQPGVASVRSYEKASCPCDDAACRCAYVENLLGGNRKSIVRQCTNGKLSTVRKVPCPVPGLEDFFAAALESGLVTPEMARENRRAAPPAAALTPAEYSSHIEYPPPASTLPPAANAH
jgi:hypothetical protein